MKLTYDSLYRRSTISSEAGVYACSQGMFEENNSVQTVVPKTEPILDTNIKDKNQEEYDE